jgi:hypothetical protein
MIMELMEKGDLKTFLRSNRPKVLGIEAAAWRTPKLILQDLKPSTLSFRRLAMMGAYVCEGMAYLSSLNIVHRYGHWIMRGSCA